MLLDIKKYGIVRHFGIHSREYTILTLVVLLGNKINNVTNHHRQMDIQSSPPDYKAPEEGGDEARMVSNGRNYTIPSYLLEFMSHTLLFVLLYTYLGR